MMPAIADLLPHSAPMILLDEVLSWDSKKATTAVTIREDSPFIKPKLGVPAHVGLEYMAQTCGAYAGLESQQHGLPVRIGFLLGTRGFSCSVEVFKVGDHLTVTASEIIRQEQMGVFQCTIHLNDEEVAKAQLTVYQPDNVDALFQETLG